MAQPPLDLAFLALYDLGDVTRGSGTWHHLVEELKRRGHRLTPLDVRPPSVPTGTRLLAGWARRLGRGHPSSQDPFYSRRIGRRASRMVAGTGARIALTNDYAIAGRLETDRPVVLYTDAMIAHDPAERRHPHHERLAPWGMPTLLSTLRQGLRRADLLIYPTRWAARQASLHHPPAAAKTEVVPFGANLPDPGPTAPRTVDDDGPVEILFIGKNWRGKGGDVALGAVRELRRRGVDAVLHLVGSEPPEPLPDDGDWLHRHGLLDKTSARDRELLDSLYRRAWALLFPTRAEGFGIAAVEAAAYGVPTLGTRVRGLEEAVDDGATGRLLAADSSSEAFTDILMIWLDDPAEHARLALGARHRYETELHWGRTAERLVEFLRNRFPPEARCKG